MIPKMLDRVACVREEKRRVFRLDVIVLRRHPEVIPDKHSVLVRQIVKGLFGTLANPVTNDVQIRVTIQTEIWLKPRSRDTLTRVVHAPVASARCNTDTVHLDDKVRRGPNIGKRP